VVSVSFNATIAQVPTAATQCAATVMTGHKSLLQELVNEWKFCVILPAVKEKHTITLK
jgi:hypothetical protein